jgi:hypothetical protein
LIVYQLEKCVKKLLRKGLHRIIYVKRKKLGFPMYIPQINILHLL